MNGRVSVVPGPGLAAQLSAAKAVMTVLDLVKATIICGLLAFVIYSFPVVGQVTLIGLLSVLWLLYAHKTIATILRR